MSSNLNILVTNDDGYTAKGIHALVDVMRQFGRVTVIAPKFHQSGMSTAVTMGGHAIAFKDLGEGWAYLDATPASCVKYAIDEYFTSEKIDLVISGINQGANTATASNYSGTLGAAEEAAINGILGIGVSLDTNDPDADYSTVQELFPQVLDSILKYRSGKRGVFFNVNFPNIPKNQVKGIRLAHLGIGHWVREFTPWDLDYYFSRRGKTAADLGVSEHPACEEGEKLYIMVGDYVDDSPEDKLCDHQLLKQGYITITAHSMDNTDKGEMEHLKASPMEKDFTDRQL